MASLHECQGCVTPSRLSDFSLDKQLSRGGMKTWLVPVQDSECCGLRIVLSRPLVLILKRMEATSADDTWRKIQDRDLGLARRVLGLWQFDS